MDVRDIVQTEVVTVRIDDTLLTAAETLRDAGVGSAVVLDVDGAPCGIVTDRDLVVYGLDHVDALEHTVVDEVMSADLFTVAASAGVFDVVERMREERVRRVPVVEGGDLVGIVTLDDLVVLLARELSGLADVIEAEMPARR
ncbi:MAG: cyclic nucleotide-binding/CBS domain-containing protein [Halobacteriaceae archaeon]